MSNEKFLPGGEEVGQTGVAGLIIPLVNKVFYFLYLSYGKSILFNVLLLYFYVSYLAFTLLAYFTNNCYYWFIRSCVVPPTYFLLRLEKSGKRVARLRSTATERVRCIRGGVKEPNKIELNESAVHWSNNYTTQKSS